MHRAAFFARPGQGVHLDGVIDRQVLEVEITLLLLAEQVLHAQLIDDGVPRVAVDETHCYTDGSPQHVLSIMLLWNGRAPCQQLSLEPDVWRGS